MQTKLLVVALTLSLITPNQFILGQQDSAGKIAILPLNTVEVEESTVQSAQAILRLEINAASNQTIVSENEVQQVILLTVD